MSAADAFVELVQVVTTLRGPNGCPWDREQTFESLTPYIIEEAYELVDAMSPVNAANLSEEIGDVLLHVVMLSLMAQDTNLFTLESTIRGISEKMIRRHPHVFGTTSVSSSDEVVHNWEAIKRQESQTARKGLLDSIPKQLPAVMQSQKLQKKAARIGFDWPTTQGAIEKITEELDEFKAAVETQNTNDMTAEFGDLLFSLVNAGRKLGIDCEAALQRTNKKFRNRFSQMESMAQLEGIPLEGRKLDELDRLWSIAKKEVSE